MGFIKGKAYSIISSMASKGNDKARQLMNNLSRMKQPEVDAAVSELMGGGRTDNKNNTNNMRNAPQRTQVDKEKIITKFEDPRKDEKVVQEKLFDDTKYIEPENKFKDKELNDKEVLGKFFGLSREEEEPDARTTDGRPLYGEYSSDGKLFKTHDGIIYYVNDNGEIIDEEVTNEEWVR